MKFLRIEALSRCGVGDDGVIQVTEGNIRNSPLRFTEQNPNCDSTSVSTGTSLTDQLSVIHLLHTERRKEKIRQGEKTRGGEEEIKQEDKRQGGEERRQGTGC